MSKTLEEPVTELEKRLKQSSVSIKGRQRIEFDRLFCERRGDKIFYGWSWPGTEDYIEAAIILTADGGLAPNRDWYERKEAETRERESRAKPWRDFIRSTFKRQLTEATLLALTRHIPAKRMEDDSEKLDYLKKIAAGDIKVRQIAEIRRQRIQEILEE